MEIIKKTFDLRPYTKKELRGMYGVSKHVFNNLLSPFVQELGTITGKYLNVCQVELILSRIGMPKTLNIA
jgi:hypothetical protein